MVRKQASAWNFPFSPEVSFSIDQVCPALSLSSHELPFCSWEVNFPYPNFSIGKDLEVYNALNKNVRNRKLFWFKAHQSIITHLSVCIWYLPCLCLFELITYFPNNPLPFPTTIRPVIATLLISVAYTLATLQQGYATSFPALWQFTAL